MMRYSGQLALVVGASGGIGRAIAAELLNNGCDAVLTCRRHGDALHALAGEAVASGRRCVVEPLDVRDAAQVAATCERVVRELGTPTILVCCAGIVRDRPLVDMGSEDWLDVVETNLFGTFYLVRQVAPAMMRNRYGRILTLASVSGIHGQPGQANYAAAKGGVIAMTRSLARELGPFNVTVNALAPGIVETEMTEPLPEVLKRQFLGRIPLRRFASPQDIVPVARLLLSPEAGYITGQVLVVDGGMTC